VPAQATSVAYPAVLKGDATPLDWLDDLDGVVQSVQVATTTRTRALIAEITSAEATDLDLYIGSDRNLDGKPSWMEAFPYLCMSADITALERCVVLDPPPGVYWISVQNFTPTSENGDHHVLAVTVVDEGGEGMSITAPATAGSEAFDIGVQWNVPMPPDASHYGVIAFGTAEDQPENIGNMLVEIRRTGDDIALATDSEEVLRGERIEYTWTVSANASGETRVHHVNFDVPAGYSVVSAEGNPAVTGARHAWTVTQAANADAVTHRLVLGTPTALLEDDELRLTFTHQLGGRVETRSTAVAPMVRVIAGPVALIDAVAESRRTTQTGKTLRIDASKSRGLRDDSELTYTWRQTRGPYVALRDLGAGIFELDAPDVAVQLEYELIVSSEGRDSAPATLQVDVRSGGGGSMGYVLLTLMVLAACRRAWSMRCT
jgi:hypothetical protein